MSLTENAAAVDELAKLARGVQRVHVVFDLDPAEPSEADIEYIAFDTPDGQVQVGGGGSSFVAVLTGPRRVDIAELKRDDPKLVRTYEAGEFAAGEVTQDTTAPLGAPGCSCVGEVGEDPACAVHGKPIV